MQELLDQIRDQYQRKLPFVCYRKPGAVQLSAYFQHDATLFHADFNTAGFIFAPFDGIPILLPASQCTIVHAAFSPVPIRSMRQRENREGQAAFENLVSLAVASINEGRFDKVVLSRVEIVAIKDFDIADGLLQLASAYPTAFAYCFYHPGIGIWIGATPEKLLKVETGRFETVALAGTQRYDDTAPATWEDKERQEQQFVTDFIMENLENVTTDIAFSDPYTHRAGNLLHLKTDISGTLRQASDVSQLIGILHPTPAVCGLPKEPARAFILRHEGYDRSFYSGYLGELYADFYPGQQLTDLFVNLRCAEIRGETARVYAGCGITAQSNPAAEFTETVHKTMTIKTIL